MARTFRARELIIVPKSQALAQIYKWTAGRDSIAEKVKQMPSLRTKRHDLAIDT
jgi:hypothetical protein